MALQVSEIAPQRAAHRTGGRWKKHRRTHNGLVCRIDAAKMLGVSVSAFYYWHKAGKIEAFRHKGAYYYSPVAIAKLKEERAQAEAAKKVVEAAVGPVPAPLGLNRVAAAQLAAKIFTELDAGKQPVLIIREQVVTPADMRSLLNEYQSLRGGLYLTRADLEQLAVLSPLFKRDFDGQSNLLDTLKKVLKPATCDQCRHRAPAFCAHCYEQALGSQEEPAPQPRPAQPPARRPIPPLPKMPPLESNLGPAREVTPQRAPTEAEMDAYLDHLERTDPAKAAAVREMALAAVAAASEKEQNSR